MGTGGAVLPTGWGNGSAVKLVVPLVLRVTSVIPLDRSIRVSTHPAISAITTRGKKTPASIFGWIKS